MAGSRYEIRDKKRKTNLILNILIGIVALLILVIASQLFLGGGTEQANSNSEQQKEQSSSSKNIEEETAEQSNDQQEEEKAAEQNESNEIKEEEDENTQSANEEKESSDDPFEGATVTEGEAGSDVEQIIENPNWKPIGTVQTGEHVTTYKKSSVDWKEMEKTLSYATGVSLENMQTLWIGNNGSPNDAKGTIQNKADGKKYRVSITWIDGEGWKPTRVEVLK
ncbi:DUF1510 family protein [Aeribacillus composti]|uniref:YrrS family protein n=1 Tax=Aeribacillus composti TaxID=1868734 RepID=UPI003D25A43E